MTFDADALKLQIPYYLSAEPARKAFVSELESLSNGVAKGYLIDGSRDIFRDEILQGDGLSGFQAFSFRSKKLENLRGIIISNSCDIAPENERVLPLNVAFVPIVKMASLALLWEKSGLSGQKIEQKLSSIRAQSVSSTFYLPAEGPLKDEYVALLSDVHSIPINVFTESAVKIFTLSMAGFYLFVFKLSVHFCRLQENIDRNSNL
jgi:hypothetical protein